jgi:hypothetical protein
MQQPLYDRYLRNAPPAIATWVDWEATCHPNAGESGLRGAGRAGGSGRALQLRLIAEPLRERVA